MFQPVLYDVITCFLCTWAFPIRPPSSSTQSHVTHPSPYLIARETWEKTGDRLRDVDGNSANSGAIAWLSIARMQSNSLRFINLNLMMLTLEFSLTFLFFFYFYFIASFAGTRPPLFSSYISTYPFVFLCSTFLLKPYILLLFICFPYLKSSQ